ncbi:MAG: hypothetical protein ABFD10_19790 [Prolixibacteraceae bacterium]
MTIVKALPVPGSMSAVMYPSDASYRHGNRLQMSYCSGFRSKWNPACRSNVFEVLKTTRFMRMDSARMSRCFNVGNKLSILPVF